ncbi:MAG TPA: hypothetical protein VGX24_02220 [Pyrinomonadaceae bacterium]|nr:hypothetical protein [Pyrinomonadaceae bacterium]
MTHQLQPNLDNAVGAVKAEVEGAVATVSDMEATEDSRITYPCYKSFDEFIDVERLKSLDGYITERIKQHIQAQKDIQFYTGPFRLENAGPDLPGSRMIYLAQSKMPDSYFDLDKTELWERTPDASEFYWLMDFIESLPFKATGRMLIMYDDVARPVTPHRDHTSTDICHEFIWFRTNMNKPFYMFNHHTNEKKYVESYSAWFDTVNQFHGTDAGTGLTFSIRVDGIFTDEFRKRIPTVAPNLASTPALWASLSD